MSGSQRTVIRYSISFKRQIVNEIEEGASISLIQRKYGIKGGETIQKWMRKFGKNHLLSKVIKIQTVEERDQLKAMQEEIKRLKTALADAYLEKRCLETLIDEANKLYKTDLKKNFGDQPSTDSHQNSQ
jgi:transposase